jgi:hypothetical protein
MMMVHQTATCLYLSQPHHLVLTRLQSAVNHHVLDVWSTHQAMQASELRNSTDLMEISRMVIIATRTRFQ